MIWPDARINTTSSAQILLTGPGARFDRLFFALSHICFVLVAVMDVDVGNPWHNSQSTGPPTSPSPPLSPSLPTWKPSLPTRATPTRSNAGDVSHPRKRRPHDETEDEEETSIGDKRAGPHGEKFRAEAGLTREDLIAVS